MYPTSQKNFKVICQDEPYFLKKIQSNLSRWTVLSKKISKQFVKMHPTFQKKFKVICEMHPTSQKNFKVICQDEPYFPKKFQSNLSRWTLLSKKNSK